MAPIRTPESAPARVALLGGESSGKTTLAAALATHYRSVWVPEYLREFTENAGRPPLEAEQLGVAHTQIEREFQALPQAQRFLFCDTTPLMIALYSDFCFGRIEAALARLAQQHTYDFTIVTAPDIAWVADGLQRASDEVRQAVHLAVVARLQDSATPYLLATGSLEHRLQQSVAYIENLQRY